MSTTAAKERCDGPALKRFLRLQSSTLGHRRYTAVDCPLAECHRLEELLRWTELGAFTTVCRTYESNRLEINCQSYSDGEILKHFSCFAKVYGAWAPYCKELVGYSTESGLPVVRHPFIYYPDEFESRLEI